MEPGNSDTGLNSKIEYIVDSQINDDDHGPVQIVKVVDKKFNLDLKSLQSILLQKSVKDKPICIIGIAGDFRKGKSFILNFIIRYLESDGSKNWIGKPDAPLTGFKWRGGSARETTGIWMYKKPFPATLPNGQAINVLLMDTQGTFDSEFTVKDFATIFALNILISSIQIYNLIHNLQESDLQILEYFTDFGILAMEKTKEKPFQKLIFLIRDWSYEYEYNYGLEGGQKFLNNKLLIKTDQPNQLTRVRKQIKSCFKEIDCFLMPHPGLKAIKDPKYDGRISSLEPEFLEYLIKFVNLVAKPENIVVKKIAGQTITGLGLFEYFKVYMETFKEERMPEPTTILEATAEANNLAALSVAKEYYIENIKGICGPDKGFVYPPSLLIQHTKLKKNSIEMFNTIKKMGGKEFSDSYSTKLEEDINKIYERYNLQNKEKSIFNRIGTAMVLFLMIIAIYVLSKIITLIGLRNLFGIGFILNLLETIIISIFITYSSFKFTNKYSNYIQIVDMLCQFLLDHVIAYISSHLIK